MGAAKALTIRRSQSCKRSRQSASILQSRFFKSTASMRRVRWSSRRQLKRRYVLAFFQKLPPCLVGIEPALSSHHWSRELQALGHTVRLMPPAYVKPYVKRQKNDAADAEAICEVVTRATMRFVETKTPEQQSCLILPSHAPSLHPPADCGDQCDPRPSCRVRDRRAGRPPWRGGAKAVGLEIPPTLPLADEVIE